MFSFDKFQQANAAYANGQIFKVILMSLAQRILIFVAALIMSLSVIFYAITDWTPTYALAGEIIAYGGIPLLIAVCVEALIILSAHAIAKNKKNVLAWVTILFATACSGLGGELFFSKIGEHQIFFVQCAFRAFGILVPLMQLTYELNQDNIKAFIKSGVDTSEVTDHILEKQTNSSIAELKFSSRSAAMKNQQVLEQIQKEADTYVIEAVRGTVVEGTLSEIEDPEHQHLLLPSTDVSQQINEAVAKIAEAHGEKIAQINDQIASIAAQVHKAVSDLSARQAPNDSIPLSSNSQGFETGPEASEIGPGYAAPEAMIDYTSVAYNEPEDVAVNSISDTSEVADEIQDNIVPFTPRTTASNMSGQQDWDNSGAVRKQSKCDQISDYLGTLSEDERITWWNDLSGLGTKFQTSSKTAQRAFNDYPQSKQKRRTAE